MDGLHRRNRGDRPDAKLLGDHVAGRAVSGGGRAPASPSLSPYILGADVGTTVTAILASPAGTATATDPAAGGRGLSVAAGRLLFNVMGVAVFWPLRRIPITLGKGFAKAASRHRGWVIVGASVF